MATQDRGNHLVYIGTYTSRKSEGIYIYRLDPDSGALTAVGKATGVNNPSFVALHPQRRFLYAVNEISEFGGKPAGAVSAFAIGEKPGELTFLNQQSSGGTGPCHLSVDRTGKFVLAANYGGGSVVVLPIREDGRLGEATEFIQHHGSSVNPNRQKEPHAHCILLDAANRFAFTADLGLDKVMIYRLDLETGKLRPHDPPSVSVKPGAGPRHFTFHPNGRYAYVIDELDSTVTVFHYDPQRGALEIVQTVSTLPHYFMDRNSPADIHVTPSGKFLYGSNRGHDSLAMFTIDEGTGKLTPIGHEPTGGKNPRNFMIDPTGTFLLAANQDTDNVVTFRIDQQTGKLQKTEHVAEVPTPVCLKMQP